MRKRSTLAADADGLIGEGRCTKQKQGEYNLLRCCRGVGHEGPCNFVVQGVVEVKVRTRKTPQKAPR
jgi:hypothetical protein